jgi:predicted DNA-binding transcriptional regulator YafY
VEPHRLVSTGYRWYLMAFDVSQADWRTFRVDRIVESVQAGQRFVPRESPDPAAFVAQAVTSAPYRYRARVLAAAPATVVADFTVLEPPEPIGYVGEAAERLRRAARPVGGIRRRASPDGPEQCHR